MHYNLQILEGPRRVSFDFSEGTFSVRRKPHQCETKYLFAPLYALLQSSLFNIASHLHFI